MKYNITINDPIGVGDPMPIEVIYSNIGESFKAWSICYKCHSYTTFATGICYICPGQFGILQSDFGSLKESFWIIVWQES
jgi:hypothetical protein